MTQDPRWKQDFPVSWERDHYVTRRELVKFLTLGSGLLAGTSGAILIWDRRRGEEGFYRKGPDMPIGVNHDMHANVSQKVIDNSTATVVYRTNPHLDAKERAEECAELIVRTIKGEIRPVQALEMPPVLVNIVKQFTGEEPMKSIVEGIPEVLARPGILSASVAEGYPYADVDPRSELHARRLRPGAPPERARFGRTSRARDRNRSGDGWQHTGARDEGADDQDALIRA